MLTVTADRATRGYALAQDKGEAFWLLGMLETIKVGRADTGGQYGLIEILTPPGLGSPWHVHPEEDEWVYVLEGNLTVAENVDDVPAVVEPMLAQQLIQARVERATRGRCEICCRDPQARLSLTLTFTHRHAADCSTRRHCRHASRQARTAVIRS